MKRGWGFGSVLEHLLNRHMALGSVLSSRKNKTIKSKEETFTKTLGRSSWLEIAMQATRARSPKMRELQTDMWEIIKSWARKIGTQHVRKLMETPEKTWKRRSKSDRNSQRTKILFCPNQKEQKTQQIMHFAKELKKC